MCFLLLKSRCCPSRARGRVGPRVARCPPRSLALARLWSDTTKSMFSEVCVPLKFLFPSARVGQLFDRGKVPERHRRLILRLRRRGPRCASTHLRRTSASTRLPSARWSRSRRGTRCASCGGWKLEASRRARTPARQCLCGTCGVLAGGALGRSSLGRCEG